MRVYLLILLALTGCSTIGQKQSECETKYTAFEDIYSCTKLATSSDPRAKTNDGYKFYMLKGEQLMQQVKDNKISNIDARVEWQNLYMQLKDGEQRASAIKKNQNTIKNTHCESNGNSVNCTSY